MMLWLVNEEERNDEENFDGEKGVRGGEEGVGNVLWDVDVILPLEPGPHVWGENLAEKYVLNRFLPHLVKTPWLV